jgi:hypothetical protein
MNRQNLIDCLVAHKLQPTGGPKTNCVRCFCAAKPSILCWFNNNNNVKAPCSATGTEK